MIMNVRHWVSRGSLDIKGICACSVVPYSHLILPAIQGKGEKSKSGYVAIISDNSSLFSSSLKISSKSMFTQTYRDILNAWLIKLN